MLSIDRNARSVDTVLTHDLKRAPSEHIISDTSHERHTASVACCGHRLIGPLAAGIHHELAAEDGLPRRRQMRSLHNHIGIAAAYDHDSFHPSVFYFPKIPFFQCETKHAGEDSRNARMHTSV